MIDKNLNKSNYTAHNRIIGLDVLRAIAIVLVVWYHSFKILTPLVNLPHIGSIINKIRVFSDWFGPLGVDLFFVLSGFLIGTILVKTFLTSINFGFNEVKNFWTRRWFRTIPNYYFMLTIAFILYYVKYDINFDFRYYFFVQNWITVHPQFFGEAWSLAVEEWFYLTLPIALLVLGNVLKDKSKKFILKITFLSYLLIFIVLRFIKAYVHNYVEFDEEIRKVVLYRLDSVMYGVIISYLMHFHKERLYKIKNKLLYIGIVSSLLIVSLFFLVEAQSNIYKQNEILRLIVDSLYFTFIPFLFSLLIPAAYFLKDIKYLYLRKVILHLSLISYSLYLIHYSIIYIPFFRDIKSTSVGSAILYYLLYWIVVITLSTINYYFFEKPTTRLRDLFSKKEQQIN